MKKFNLATLCALCFALALGCATDQSADVNPNSQTGTGGSMARFAIVGDVLYCVLPDKLQVYTIANPTNPVSAKTIPLTVGLETIFPYKNALFIGANAGMYIFDNQQPDSPVLLSSYFHVQSCDPVVVQGNYAYVTLRGGSGCRRMATASTLDVVDVTDLKNPKLINSQTMESPYGLGVSGDQLFVCEGDRGMKIFDLADPKQPKLKHVIGDIKAYDVIPTSKSLLVTGDGGLVQYGLQEGGKLEVLSKLAIEP